MFMNLCIIMNLCLCIYVYVYMIIYVFISKAQSVGIVSPREERAKIRGFSPIIGFLR